MIAPFRLAVFAAVLALLLPAQAPAEVVYRERIEHFEIGVRDGTPEDIWTAIRRYGPFIKGKHAVGSAAGRLKWSDLSIARRGHSCRLDAHAVDVEVVMTLPEWWRARNAPDDQLTYWQCIERTVTVHEQRHAEIWRETAETIDRAFHRFDDWMACDELRAAIGETGNRLFQAGARRQRDFDEADRRRRRYEQCARPSTAITTSADAPPHNRLQQRTAAIAADRQPPAGGLARNTRAAPHGGMLGGDAREPQTEDVPERNALDVASGLAAALLAMLAAIGGYSGVMVGVVAWSRRARHARMREIDE